MNLRVAVIDECSRGQSGLLDAVAQSAEIDMVAQGTHSAEAMQIVERLEPEILLLAPSVPRQGLPTLQKVVDSPFSTKVAVLSSSDHKSDVLTALRSGASGYIIRNSAVSLTEALLQIHRSSIYVSPEVGMHLLLELAQTQDIRMDTESDWIASKGCRLSDREREIISLVRQGFRNKEIAIRLKLQEGTVKQHLNRVFRKLRINSRAELTALA